MKVKSLSRVPTLSDLMDCSPPGSSVHGIFQARVLEWVAIAFSTMIYIRECSAYVFLWELVMAREKAVAAHSSTLAWQIPWTEEPGGLQSMGSLRVGHD